MRFNKVKVLQTFVESGMAPVFYHPQERIAAQVMQACYQGGARLFEFTNRGEHAQEVFAALSKYAAAHCPQMIVGAGSIVDAATAAMYIQMGANFIVSPLLNPDTAKVCNRRGIAYIPGCGSITEVGMAMELGSVVCKVFPGDVLGVSFVRALLAPMPWALLMVTGGVKPEADNLRAWLDAGACCVGMGSNLFPAQALAAEDYTQITQLTKTALEYIQQARQP
jgi:2-dehydro-3-deoxyphosphogluconate aldolase/(4S)-4-hydroxy-2-oxoglutarate aldolase